mmetsp:Transcript_40124/g.66883  ORF Transcript_40124/g.66883 Transcript_40124/m.66883 type:complete len:205 (+) Transcript_40124:500-1114(+)
MRHAGPCGGGACVCVSVILSATSHGPHETRVSRPQRDMFRSASPKRVAQRSSPTAPGCPIKAGGQSPTPPFADNTCGWTDRSPQPPAAQPTKVPPATAGGLWLADGAAGPEGVVSANETTAGSLRASRTGRTCHQSRTKDTTTDVACLSSHAPDTWTEHPRFGSRMRVRADVDDNQCNGAETVQTNIDNNTKNQKTQRKQVQTE